MAFAPSPDLTALVMYFKSANQGWSERHWLAPISPTAFASAVKSIVDYRLALLPPSLSLVYAKTSRVGRPPDSIPVKYAYPTPGTFPGDVVVSPATVPDPGSLVIEVSQIAVSLRVWTADGTVANRWIHGIPDNRVTAEVLTNALNESTTAPPAVNTFNSAVDWPTRFGYYLYVIATQTVFGRKVRSTQGIDTWYSDVLADMAVTGVVSKKTGRPFRQQAGHARVG